MKQKVLLEMQSLLGSQHMYPYVQWNKAMMPNCTFTALKLG